MPFSRLNYRHLYYFWMVAGEGNLTRVAERLHVSQSALSTQIRQLEEQMGHALFLREKRALKLTEMGHLVLDYADNIFAMGSELVETTRRSACGSVALRPCREISRKTSCGPSWTWRV